jgi:diguanylate cyclase (GGDEF)-like protein
MSTQPILIVIGIAIAVNLVIMGGLLVSVLARRRSQFATPDGIVEPEPYRYSAITTSPPTATAAISYIDDDDEEYERADEDLDQTVSATEPADYRRFRPVMSDEGERVETTIASFLSPTPAAAAAPQRPAAAEGPAPTPIAPRPVAAAPRPVAATAPRRSAGAADGQLDWETRLRDEEARLARYRRPVSVVLVEVDGMERLVERLGPDAAERLVPPVGQTLTRQARAADHVARIGLSRFAVLLPETDEIQAINYVERVRAECDRWLAAGAVATRLAIGWACPTPGGDLRSATRIAEDRLNADRRRAFPRADLEPEPVAPAAPRPFAAPDLGGYGEVELTPPDGAE